MKNTKITERKRTRWRQRQKDYEAEQSVARSDDKPGTEVTLNKRIVKSKTLDSGRVILLHSTFVKDDQSRTELRKSVDVPRRSKPLGHAGGQNLGKVDAQDAKQMTVEPHCIIAAEKNGIVGKPDCARNRDDEVLTVRDSVESTYDTLSLEQPAAGNHVSL